ncbi:unnamed protein product [Caenorhabditis auriculariae]|uniref:Uncharacterized protein n=1 Tax=Caenorhabditis auriculariae TaxID=2777116 RepID=A0A8S1HNT5_9PELO|nr:unnamed protein product [Caenorhabditis auriculariae]
MQPASSAGLVLVLNPSQSHFPTHLPELINSTGSPSASEPCLTDPRRVGSGVICPPAPPLSSSAIVLLPYLHVVSPAPNLRGQQPLFTVLKPMPHHFRLLYRFQMRLGVFLLAAFAAGCCASTSETPECIVGNALVRSGIVESKSVESRVCDGLCRKQSIQDGATTLVLFSCEDNKMEVWLNSDQSCSESKLENSCFCRGQECNKLSLPEQIPEPTSVDLANNIACFTGFAANNSFSQGTTIRCAPGNACIKLNGTYQNFDAEIYACMPAAVCTNLLGDPNTSGTKCASLQGSPIQGCCCYDADCTTLVSPGITVPTPGPIGGNNIQCYQGVAINGVPMYNGTFNQCQGECGSVRIRSTLNGQNIWGEVFSCDPVSIFSNLNIDNQCRTIDSTNVTGIPTALITGCACNTDKCLDPTAFPPVYPVRQLKCAVGLYNGSTWLGAEMGCDGRCGRLAFKFNGQNVKYYTCAPYSICAGFGLESSEGLTYNPPQDEELEAYCCSAWNNCNVDEPSIARQVNNTAVSTVKYPILCYGGIWVNGVPITGSSYGLCQGECASANFMTTIGSVQHNATIYTCDPVTMCSSAGISNGCSSVFGVNACCCDSDTCLDPTRGAARPNLRCYAGISIPGASYNQGGDMFCDGWCGSLNATLNGNATTVYFCAPIDMCRFYGLGIGGANTCGSIVGADPPVTGCCCSDSDNCLAPPGVNVTAIPARVDPKIVCYEGLYINGNNATRPYYRICDGECVSMQMGGTINGTTHFATLYTCDPSSACASIGVRNNCSTIEPSLNVCCCDSDECIDPTVQRVPGRQLLCYVGVKSTYNNLSVGAEIACNGYCASISSHLGDGYDIVAFHCAPRSVCRSLGLDNSNNTLYLDRAVTASCCDSSNYCNTIGYNVNLTGLTVSQNEQPRACYQGIFVNSQPVSSAGWTACLGDCVAVNVNTTYNNQAITASLYTCDPTTVCRGLNATNRCTSIEPGYVEACCCDSDACLDPTVNPPRKPNGGDGNLCYVGVYSYDSSNNTILNAGGESYCAGTCASMTSKIGGNTVTAYACSPNYICSYLGLYDDCNSVDFDRTVSGCCCTNGPNCNLDQVSPRPPPTPRGIRRREFPITCPAGIVINNVSVTPLEFQVCNGDCASITINGTIGSTPHIATLFSCDPSNVCQQLNLTNNCGSPEPGLTGCCCNTDACLDPRRGKYVPTPPLTCYVGIYSEFNPALRTGAEIPCSGKCAQLNTTVGTDNAHVFACVPHSVCRSLELYDTCSRLGYPYLEFDACCCDNYDNCNVGLVGMNDRINTSIPITPLDDFPISCYSGLFINGTAYSSAGWTTCQGECASISMTAQINNIYATATLYTCDPTLVCRTLGIVNNCTTLENGVTGCCCNTGGCLDPSKFPPRTPGNPLLCYAGIQSNYTVNGAPLSVGSDVVCSGKCSSLSGMINGYMVNSYHCVPSSICRGLELYDSCKTIPGDRAITGCCCDNVNNCNINGTNIVPAPPGPNVDYTVACYSGVYVNGVAATDISVSACQGQCASISLTTSYMGQNGTAVLYGCDPTAVCGALGMTNGCANPEPGVRGCCCNSDLCLDPTKGVITPASRRVCYAGIYYQNKAQGGEVDCDGTCASLNANINGDPVTVFACVPRLVCSKLEIYDACKTMQLDRAVTGCCCENGDNCNINLAGFNGTITPTRKPTNRGDYPITCYSGVQFNTTSTNFVWGADAGWQACQGSCASVSLTTTFNNTLTTATIYSCDPVDVCVSLNVYNNCSTIENGLTGCCCQTDACLDPTKTPPKTPGNPLMCYVGIKSVGPQNINVGAETFCWDGQCASLNGQVGQNNVTVYSCVSNLVCKTLQIFDTCAQMPLDRDITACCCDNYNNCNVKNDSSITIGPVTPFGDFPIACFQGLVANGNPVTPLALSQCWGQCASINITTTLNNGTNTATLYTCDPTAVCQQLNMTNGCATPEPGITGCCCDSDACINPYTNTYPGPLACYVGAYTADGKINAGATVPCDGYCGSINTTYNGVLYKTYHCVPKTICHTLEVNNVYRTISTDRDITAYCCTTGTNCHVTEPAVKAGNVTYPDPNTKVVACLSSIYLNGASVTGDVYTGCRGSCASITYNTTLNGAPNVATLYTCDPTSVCSAMNLQNNCVTLDAGLSGCCCNSDVCVAPGLTPAPGGSASGLGAALFTALVAVYIALWQQ